MNIEERAKLVRSRRDELGMTQGELAAKAKVSLSYIQKLEGATEEAGSRANKLIAVAIALGLPEQSLRRVVVDGITTADKLPTPDRDLRNVAKAPKGATGIPSWPALAVAASRWVDIHEVGEPEQIEAWTLGYFVVPISGQCMQPVWWDGEQILFQLLLHGRDFEAGQDYYIQRNSEATFKRCYHVDESEIIIGCVNPDMGAKRWTVKRADISRAAIARYALRDPRQELTGEQLLKRYPGMTINAPATPAHSDAPPARGRKLR